MRIRVRKGDTVRILSGKDRGKSGTVEKVSHKDHQVVVGGLNLIKKHRRSRGKVQGGIITVPAPLPISRVMVVCPHCQKPVRIAITLDTDGARMRTCRKCGQTLLVSKEK